VRRGKCLAARQVTEKGGRSEQELGLIPRVKANGPFVSSLRDHKRYAASSPHGPACSSTSPRCCASRLATAASGWRHAWRFDFHLLVIFMRAME